MCRQDGKLKLSQMNLTQMSAISLHSKFKFWLVLQISETAYLSLYFNFLVGTEPARFS